MKKTLNKSAVALAVAVVTATSPISSNAALEEIVVTATKREVGLQEVPIAISVMTGESISNKGITNLADISSYMPNVHIGNGPQATQLFVRGVGSGANYGFEQSVGTFVDGVYFGRGRSARGKFLDLERVEVLKGPQATLFGKNTIAGAINITTAKPTEEFEAYVDLSYRTELEGVGLTAMVSGAMSDTVRGRFVAKKYSDDGYIRNQAPGGVDAPIQDLTSFRATFEWDASDDLMFTLKTEHGNYDVKGAPLVTAVASPTANFFYLAFGTSNFKPGFGYDSYNLGFPGQPVFDDTESSLIQLTADYALGEHTLRSITAYTEYEFSNVNDTDFGPLAFIARGRTEKLEQLSQEILLTSPNDDNFEYLAGAFYQTEDLQNNRFTDGAFSALPPVEASIYARIGAAGLPAGALDGRAYSNFAQDTDSWSVFAEGTWHLSDTFRTTVGLRYSDDSKSMSKVSTLEQAKAILPYQTFAYLWSGPLGIASNHAYELERDETHTTGHVNFQWDANDDTMVYFNVGNGYKAGGFDEDNGLGRMKAAEFEDEEVVSFELGAKMTIADGDGRLNIAVFSSDYEDVQVSTFDGNAAFIVGNAAESKVQGIEADIEYAVSDSLTLNGAFSYLDAKYDSFKTGPCTVTQITAAVAATGSRACEQDLSGQVLQYAPELTINVGINYATSLSNGMGLDLGLDYNWSDDTVIAVDHDPAVSQDAYGKLGARIALRDSDEKWQIALVGKNLTDKKTSGWGNDVSLGSLGFDNSYYRYIDPPRTWEISARYNF